MPATLHFLYRTRRLSFTATALIITGVVWLLLTDILFRYPITGMMLWQLKFQFGFWPAVDHATRGLMGVYMVSKPAHWFATFLLLATFFTSAAAYLHPRHGWTAALTRHGPPHPRTIAATSLAASILTLGLASMLLEIFGLWRHMPGPSVAVAGFILQPSFWLALPLLFIAWKAWSILLHKRWRTGDRFTQLATMLFWLYVVSGTELLIGGLFEAYGGFLGNYWERGTFTTAQIGFAGMLWTMLPAVALLYAIQPYCRAKQGLCVHCGQRLQPATLVAARVSDGGSRGAAEGESVCEHCEPVGSGARLA